MAVKTDSCPVCGYPVKYPDAEGQTVSCVYCQTPMTASITSEFNAGPLFIAGIIVAIIFMAKNGMSNRRSA